MDAFSTCAFSRWRQWALVSVLALLFVPSVVRAQVAPQSQVTAPTPVAAPNPVPKPSPVAAPVQVAAPAEQIAGAPARRLTLAGVSNFGQVTPLLFRGAQPSQEGFANLKKLGIDIVVNLRPGGEAVSEERIVTKLGMRYVNIPWDSSDQPDNKKVANFLELLRANPDKRVFVHCFEGRDRTGVMVAVFRMTDQHWTPQQAAGEMDAFHFHGFWFHSWKMYVKNFAQQFANDATFQPLRAAAAAPAASSSSPQASSPPQAVAGPGGRPPQ